LPSQQQPLPTGVQLPNVNSKDGGTVTTATIVARRLGLRMGAA
jgi:hypothetical protein